MSNERNLHSDNKSERISRPELSEDFLISEIEVESLFGRYNYRVSSLSEEDARQGAAPLMMLYGGNGSGKTTLLRILWHLFSPSPNSGHRTNLRESPFRRFEVRLGNGDVVKAVKVDEIVGDLLISVVRNGEVIAEEMYSDRSSALSLSSDQLAALLAEGEGAGSAIEYLKAARRTIRSADQYRASWTLSGPPGKTDTYVDYLAQQGFTPVLLADDRRMHFDVPDEQQKKAAERHRRTGAEEISREDSQLAIQVEQAIRRTHDWLRQSVLTGAQEGSQSVDDVYQQVLLQLSSVGDSESSVTRGKLRNRLQDLEKRSRQFTEFGIFSGFRAAPYVELIQAAGQNRIAPISSVLTPYLSAQDARLDKLQPLEEILRLFVTNVNRYLTGKRVEFTLQRGLVIIENHSDMRLRASQLSSGERQLLLLLCNALLSRVGTRLFIIDEPELSLNARWQRKIVGSLLDCVKGSNVQFVMATHSIEILTTHRRFLAKLEER